MIWRSLGKAYDWEMEKFRVANVIIFKDAKKSC